MRLLKRTVIVAALMAFAASQLNAQYLTTHAKSAIPGQQKGVYYALPRTVLQFDFVVEETQLFEGPYSDYADFVGATDYITKDGKEFRIVDVKMRSAAEADPNATFFLAMNSKKPEEFGVRLTSKGILLGVGAEGPSPTTNETIVTDAPVTSQDYDVSFKYRYGAVGNKSEEQLARAAADMVTKIRDEKIKLLTGFQETAFTLETYRQMYADLDEMEQDYLNLFVGKKVTKSHVYSVYVTPSKDVPLQTIGKFSTQSGFTAGTAGSGDVITVQVISLQTTGTINQLSPSAVESMVHENKLFYRIPETANVKVSLGTKQVLLECRETIAQLGTFMLAPLGKTVMSFDPVTGQLTNFGQESLSY